MRTWSGRQSGDQRASKRKQAVKAIDIMTAAPITVTPQSSVMEAVRLMLQNRFSGLPVVDRDGAVVGIVTEGDLLRRAETGTQRRRPRWIEFLVGPGRLAADYAQACGHKIDEVMTRTVQTITENTRLDAIVNIMERHQIKRLPVVRDGKLVGIVSRSNLLRALASVARETRPTTADDASIRDRLKAELSGLSWAPSAMIDVVVRDGKVHLWGAIIDERQRQGIRVAVENTAGVTSVEDHMVWIEPTSGMVVMPGNEQPIAEWTSRVAAR
jgi:CBS domain-containing protein